MNNEEDFERREGTNDKGRDYEFLISAYYSLLLAFDDTVANFKLSSNNILIGKFINVVIEVAFKNGEKHLFISQLKHTTKEFTVNSMAKPRHTFELLKYYKEFVEIYKNSDAFTTPFENFHFTLMTVAKLKVFEQYDKEERKTINVDSKIMPGKIAGGKVTVYKYDKDASYKFFNISTEKDYVTFRFESTGGEMDQRFFKQFSLLTQQMDVSNVANLIKQFFITEFPNSDPRAPVHYMNFFKEWCVGTYGSIKLTKNIIKYKLAEILLTPYIPNVDFSHIIQSETEFQLFETAVKQFDITLITTNEKSVVESAAVAVMTTCKDYKRNFQDLSWNAKCSNFNQDQILKEYPPYFLLKTLDKLTLRNLHIFAWHLNLEPLFIKIDSINITTVLKAMELCKSATTPIKRTFLLFIENEKLYHNLNFSENWKVLRHLQDIQDKDLITFNKMSAILQVSVQQRPMINVNQLFNEKEEIASLISIKEIIDMLNKTLVIDEDWSYYFPENYINRFTIPIIFNPKIIDLHPDDIFIISTDNRNVNLKNCFITNTIEIDNYILLDQSKTDETYIPQLFSLDYLKENASKQDFNKLNNTHFVIVSPEFCTKEQFETICSMNSNRNCHHLRIIDQNQFEWVETKGHTNHLRKYQIHYNEIKEELYIPDGQFLSKFSNKLNVLCADPGMGKSIILNNLRYLCPSNYWVILVNLNDHVKYLRDNRECSNEGNLIYFSNFKNKSKFVQRIIEIILAKKKILIFWDGYDELPDDCTPHLISIIKNLYSNVVQQWITSRNCSKEILEDTFNLFSLTLTQFNIQDQANYIHKRCAKTCEEYNYNIEQVIDVIQNIYDVLWKTGYGDLSGVPLHIFMITEIFIENPHKYMENVQIVTTVDVYKEFINGKFNLLFGKANADLNNYHMTRIRDGLKHSLMIQYEAAALQSTLDEDTFENLNLTCDDLLEDITESKDELGIILNINDEKKAVFAHRTYQEFLVASWLSKYYKEHRELVEKLFLNEFTNIRYMFDTLLASDSQLHLAVLTRNVNLLNQLINDEIPMQMMKDKAGRNLLHVACSWGDRFPLIRIETDDNGIAKNMTRLEDTLAMDKTEEVLKNIIELLLKHNVDPFQRDGILNWNIFEYIDASLCLRAFEYLLSFSRNHNLNLQINLNLLHNCSDMYYILHYSIGCNLPNLFDLLEYKPYMEYPNVAEQDTLLQLSVEMNRTYFVSKLLEFDHYKAVIDTENNNGVYPLLSATLLPNFKLTRILLKNGAKINGHQISLLISLIHSGNIENSLTIMESAGCFLEFARLPEQLPLKEKLDKIKRKFFESSDPLALMNDTTEPIGESIKFFQLLIDYGLDVNQCDALGSTPLLEATAIDRLAFAKILVENGADTNYCKKSYNSLFFAMYHQNVEMVKVLLEHGADVNMQTPNKLKTALHYVCEISKFDSLECLETLLDAGADTKMKTSELSTPLHLALIFNKPEIASKLIDIDPTVINEIDVYGLTALNYATLGNYPKLIQKLLDSNADIECGTLESPLCTAVSQGFISCMEILINAGSDINWVDQHKRSLLFYALKHIETLRYLIARNVDINRADHFGFTPLYFAAIQGLIEPVKILCENGANVNFQSFQQYTPLDAAVMKNESEIARILLDFKATINPVTFTSAIMNDCYESVLVMLNYGINLNMQVNGLTPLQYAVMQNHKYVEQILKYNVDVDIKDSTGLTPLNYAILLGKIDSVRLLIKAGANLYMEGSVGGTALHDAASFGNIIILILLLEANIDPNLKDSNGTTPLHCTIVPKEENYGLKFSKHLQSLVLNLNLKNMIYVSNNHVECAKELITRGANVNSINNKGLTPLHLAAAYKLSNYVEILLKAKSYVNIQDKLGFTPLQLSCIRSKEFINLLIKDSFNSNETTIQMTQLLLEQTEEFDDNSCIETVKLLLSNGANINEGSVPPIDLAVYSNNLELVQILLQHNAQFHSIETTERFIEIPLLYIACVRQNTNLVKCLLEHNIAVDAADSMGQTSLHYACTIKDHLEIVQILIENGLNVNYQNKYGITPLGQAVASNCIETVKYLLKNKADHSIADNDGQTPLFYAIQKNSLELIECLAENGANLEVVDANQCTPLLSACEEENIEIAECLLRLGCNVNVQDKNGKTPLHFSALKENFELAKVLIRHNANINILNNDNNSALIAATVNGTLQMVSLFYDAFNLEWENALAQWKKAFFLAAYWNKMEILEFILDKQIVTVTATDQITNATALHFSCTGNAFEASLYLIENGANINALTTNEVCPLLSAIAQGIITDDLIDLLIQMGADINICNNNGNSSLYCAAAKELLPIVQFLHENGAEIHVVDNQGDTPLHDAAAAGHLNVIKYLVRNGAYTNFQNKMGKTPLDLAIEKEHQNVIEFLQRNVQNC